MYDIIFIHLLYIISLPSKLICEGQSLLLLYVNYPKIAFFNKVTIWNTSRFLDSTGREFFNYKTKCMVSTSLHINIHIIHKAQEVYTLCRAKCTYKYKHKKCAKESDPYYWGWGSCISKNQHLVSSPFKVGFQILQWI